MSTWNGTPKKFKLEYYRSGNYGWASYEDIEYNWEYNTTSDILTVKIKDPEKEYRKLYGKDDAEALLHTLASWYSIYEGKENLKNLLKDLI